MSKYVCKGAKLKCSFGSSQSDLDVIHPAQPTNVGGGKMANIMDYKPMVNIKPFGQCKSLANPTVAAATAANYGKLQEMPCIPNTTSPWMPGNTNAKIKIKGKPALMDDCKLMCMWGGNIEIPDTKQKNTETGAGVITKKEMEKKGKAVVHFRPNDDYNGEYGFDWLRVKDNNLHTKPPFNDPPYENTIIAAYKDDSSNYLSREAYEEMEKEYEEEIKIKTLGFDQYRVPYLNLFSKEFSDSVTDPDITPKPPYEATLKVLVEIKLEEIKEIKFEYDPEFFTITPDKLNDTAPCALKVANPQTIKITCKKDITTDKDIKVYSYPKGKDSEKNKTLAGRIIVGRNDDKRRKHVNFVFVTVKTNILKLTKEGKFDNKEKEQLTNTLYQALVTSKVYDKRIDNKPILLNLTSDSKFNDNGEYVDILGRINTSVGGYSDPKNSRFPLFPIFDYLKDTFMKDPNNSDYRDYFPIFSFGVDAVNLFAQAASVGFSGPKCCALFNLYDPEKEKELKKAEQIVGHEVLHCFGLRHTHLDEGYLPLDDKKQKYIFPSGKVNPTNEGTDNIMSYRFDFMITTWKWQWDILRSYI